MHNPHLGKLRFKSLQILLLAQELKSLRAVANAVSTSQPAVTQTLQELERTFGEPLLVRDHSGVQLTRAGELLAARAKVALEEMGAAIGSLRGGKAVPVLRLGVLPFLMYDLVPRTLQHLQGNGVTLRLQVHETYVQDLRQRLLDGEDDVVLTRLAASAVDAEQFKSIRIQRLATETVTPFVGQRHPLYPLALRGQAVNPALLADCDWVLPPESTEVRRTVDEMLVLSGLPPAIPVVEVHSLHGMMMIVGATGSIGAGPLSAVRRMTELLKLAPLNLLKLKPPKTFTVAMHHARQDNNPLIPLFLSSVMQARDTIAAGDHSASSSDKR
jgi:DNA-binding transcriptional LysR family regulator